MPLSLQDLVKTGQLKAHSATAEEVRRLLAAILRNLADAGLKGNSFETRFDCAYKAIMQSALVALLANGYRPSTSAPGHHQTMMQSLPLTLGVGRDTWIVLDALRKKRNQSDYTGVALSEAEVSEAIAQANGLLATLRTLLRQHHPRMLK